MNANVEHSQPPAAVPPPGAMRLLQPLRAMPAAFAHATPCSSCRVRESCLPGHLSAATMQALDHVVIGRRRLRAGEVLVREADPMRYLYAVRVGTLKAATILNDGREQVGAFLLAGDLFGFDAFARGAHQRSVIALEDSEVCSIPFGELMRLPAQANGELAWRISELAGGELTRDQHLFAITALRNVEPRLAAFLLWMSRRMQERGFSGTEFELRMSRAEIGSFLRVTLESVSRAFTALAEQGLIGVAKRRVRIVSAAGLAGLCTPAMPARGCDEGETAPRQWHA